MSRSLLVKTDCSSLININIHKSFFDLQSCGLGSIQEPPVHGLGLGLSGKSARLAHVRHRVQTSAPLAGLPDAEVDRKGSCGL